VGSIQGFKVLGVRSGVEGFGVWGLVLRGGGLGFRVWR
jgi:hypothetical protein